MKLILLLFALLFSFFTLSKCETAFFAFTTNGDSKEFIIKLTTEDSIQTARDILSGKETEKLHVLGRIKKNQAFYNPNYSFHLDENTISFFTIAIEVCDASLSYVQDHIDEACGGCFYCPWSSKLTKEVTPSEL
ncbi:hypothetical protein ACTFIZ_012107 [Dictyostelium cf. discoideum]